MFDGPTHSCGSQRAGHTSVPSRSNNAQGDAAISVAPAKPKKEHIVPKCIYCGGSSNRSNCPRNPGSACCIPTEGRCSYCGGSSNRNNCPRRHGEPCVVFRPGKCSYCGGSTNRTSCPNKHGEPCAIGAQQ